MRKVTNTMKTLISAILLTLGLIMMAGAAGDCDGKCMENAKAVTKNIWKTPGRVLDLYEIVRASFKFNSYGKRRGKKAENIGLSPCPPLAGIRNCNI